MSLILRKIHEFNKCRVPHGFSVFVFKKNYLYIYSHCTLHSICYPLIHIANSPFFMKLLWHGHTFRINGHFVGLPLIDEYFLFDWINFWKSGRVAHVIKLFKVSVRSPSCGFLHAPSLKSLAGASCCRTKHTSLQWRHNGHNGVSNHQPHGCLLNRLFRRRSKKTSKLRVIGLCAGNSPETGEFHAQRASNAETSGKCFHSSWWRHHNGIFISDLTWSSWCLK